MVSPTVNIRDIFIFCLLIYYYVSVVLVSGSIPQGCEMNVGHEYHEGTPHQYFLKSFREHTISKFLNADEINVDAGNYFAALFDPLFVLIGELQIKSPREYCQRYQQDFINGENICIEALSYFLINDNRDTEAHANISGSEVFEYMYFQQLYNQTLRNRENNLTLDIMDGYYNYMVQIAENINPEVFPSISTYCADPSRYTVIFHHQ